jgi:hypothetical protein
VYDLPGDELGNGESDDIHGLIDVGDDASHLRNGQAVAFGTKAEHHLVAVDRVDSRPQTGRNRPLSRITWRACVAHQPAHGSTLHLALLILTLIDQGPGSARPAARVPAPLRAGPRSGPSGPIGAIPRTVWRVTAGQIA